MGSYKGLKSKLFIAFLLSNLLSGLATVNAQLAYTLSACHDGTNGAIFVDVSSFDNDSLRYFLYDDNLVEIERSEYTTSTTYIFDTLAADDYVVGVRDGTAFPDFQGVTISLDDSLHADLDSSNITCNGANDGTITLSNSVGGTGSYEYTINGTGGPWQGSGSFTDLAPNTYDVKIRDANINVCYKTLDGSLTLSEPPALSADHDSSNITCNGDDDGTITISNPAGGSGNYQYTIDGGSTAWQSSGSFTNLAPGTYDVRMRDANNPTCELNIDNSLVLTEPASLNGTIDVVKNLACKDRKSVV